MVLVRFEPLNPLTPDPDFGNLILCFLASYWEIPIFSIRDSELLGESLWKVLKVSVYLFFESLQHSEQARQLPRLGS